MSDDEELELEIQRELEEEKRIAKEMEQNKLDQVRTHHFNITHLLCSQNWVYLYRYTSAFLNLLLSKCLTDVQ